MKIAELVIGILADTADFDKKVQSILKKLDDLGGAKKKQDQEDNKRQDKTEDADKKRSEARQKRSKQFADELTKLTANLFAFEAMLTGGKGLGSFIKDSINSAAATYRFGQNIGMSTENLGKWETLVKNSGGSADALRQTVGGLADIFSKLKNHISISSDEAGLLSKLGLNYSDLEDTDKALEKIADRLIVISQTQGRQQAVFLGKKLGLDEGSINGMLDPNYRANLAQAKQQAPTSEAGKSAVDFQNTYSKMLSSLTHSFQQLFIKIEPKIEALITSVTGWIDNLNASGSDWVVGALSIAMIALTGIITKVAVSIGLFLIKAPFKLLELGSGLFFGAIKTIGSYLLDASKFLVGKFIQIGSSMGGLVGSTFSVLINLIKEWVPSLLKLAFKSVTSIVGGVVIGLVSDSKSTNLGEKEAIENQRRLDSGNFKESDVTDKVTGLMGTIAAIKADQKLRGTMVSGSMSETQSGSSTPFILSDSEQKNKVDKFWEDWGKGMVSWLEDHYNAKADANAISQGMAHGASWSNGSTNIGSSSGGAGGGSGAPAGTVNSNFMSVPNAPPPGADLHDKESYLAKLEDANKLPAGLLDNIWRIESRRGQNATRSTAGAQGDFQFMPGTAKQYGVDVKDFGSSARGSAQYFTKLIKMFNGDFLKAAAAFNMGEGSEKRHNGLTGVIQRWGDQWEKHLPAETAKYVANVRQGMMDNNTKYSQYRNSNSMVSHDNSSNIGDVHIHTDAKSAPDIAKDAKGHLQSQLRWVGQSNYGLA